MKKRATLLVNLLLPSLFLFSQPVNTHRAITWDGWPANVLNQSNFFQNFGPDNVTIGLKFSFSGTSSPNTASVYTFANESGGRTSSLKVEKNKSEELLVAELKINKNIEGLNLEFNPYNATYVDIKAYDLSNNPVNVAGSYDISQTDPVTRVGNRITGTGNKDINIYFEGPVATVVFESYKANANANKHEFAMGPAAWYNSTAAARNPDLVNTCEGNQIMMILDASTSIDALEQTQLVASVEAMLDDLKYYITSPNQISFVEFSTKSRLGLDYTNITPASIAPGGAIYNYLHNTTGSGYYSTNALYGGYTNWSQGFKIALEKARVQKPNLLMFFTDGAPNKIFEANDGSSSNLLSSAAWGVNRSSLYADTLKKMGVHMLGIGADKIHTQNRDFYFKNLIEMVNPEIYNYLVAPPSNLKTADYFTVATFAELPTAFNNLFSTCYLLLPVKFESLQVQQTDCISNSISWKTVDQSSIRNFEIEKSSDAVHFEVIGNVAASNETAKSHSYSFIDRNLNAKNIFYRIKANGLNGEIIYSGVSMMQTRCVNNLLTISPNPVSTGIQSSIQFNNPYKGTINVYVDDMMGRRVFAQTINKLQTSIQIQTDLNNLSRGLYHLSITDEHNNFLGTLKFLKQ